jgi:hypothetical protein
LKHLGINPKTLRPEWSILTYLLVPPVTVRPSITLESGERSEDDLTHKLSDIIRANQRLWENLNAGAPEVIIEDLCDLLQYHITTFFDNSDNPIFRIEYSLQLSRKKLLRFFIPIFQPRLSILYKYFFQLENLTQLHAKGLYHFTPNLVFQSMFPSIFPSKNVLPDLSTQTLG